MREVRQQERAQGAVDGAREEDPCRRAVDGRDGFRVCYLRERIPVQVAGAVSAQLADSAEHRVVDAGGPPAGHGGVVALTLPHDSCTPQHETRCAWGGNNCWRSSPRPVAVDQA